MAQPDDGRGKELASLKQELADKEAKIALLTQQVDKMKETTGRVAQILEHSKMQSGTIKNLKEQLRQTEAAVAEVSTSPATGKGLAELRAENEHLKKQIGQYDQVIRKANLDKQKLQRDLESCHQQLEKVAKRASVCEELEQAGCELEQKNVVLQARVSNLSQDVTSAQSKATQLATKMDGLDQELERLRREKQDLLGEAEALRVNLMTFADDFKQEREDRQNAHGRMSEIKADHINETDALKARLDQTQRDLKHHKEALQNTEQLLVALKQQLQKEITSRDDEIVALQEAKAGAEQEVLSKIQQVKHYKKQMDQLKAFSEQSSAYKNQSFSYQQTYEREQRGREAQTKSFDEMQSALKLGLETERAEVHRLNKIVTDLEKKCERENEKLEFFEKEFDFTVVELNHQITQLKSTVQPQPMEREDTELARYRIMAYQPLSGDTFSGAGSYGSVHRVRVNNIPCIAKRILDILVGRGREEAVSEVEKHAIQLKFQRECILLSRMRHPNIVQFMGVHYPDQNPLDLTLIMEFLPMDLEKCLKKYPNLPLPIKLSILLDVSYGLLHLHNASIIHRDFTAANVLLTHDMRAKITDLGVSKILDVHPRQMSKQTALPGAIGYMPPEALWEEPVYATKLDIFSFGVLALYVGVQVYPEFYDLKKDEPRDSEQIRKRRKWIQMLPGKGCGCLQRVVVQCLQDEAAHRPTTERLNIMLKQLSQDHPRQCTDIVHLEEELARMKLQVKN